MFKFDLLDIEDFQIKKVGEKELYNLDLQSTASEWCKEDLKGLEMIETIQLKNSVTPGYSNIVRGVENKIAYMDSASNSVQYNTQRVSFYSECFSNRGGFSVTKKNFMKCICFFTARKSIKQDWVNDKDEYLKPNEEHEQFEQFKYDSLVYSLFNNSSNQSSLRQVTYKGKLWDIKNEFFWMSAEQMKELADNNGYDNLYNDARTSPNRHVYNLLFGEERIYDKLSPDAKAVLDKATELVEKSMKMRMMMANDENHLDSWDAGYAQLKLVWKEYFSDDFKEFRQLYKNMEDRMRPLVYELGFLMK